MTHTDGSPPISSCQGQAAGTGGPGAATAVSAADTLLGGVGEASVLMSHQKLMIKYGTYAAIAMLAAEMSESTQLFHQQDFKYRCFCFTSRLDIKESLGP